MFGLDVLVHGSLVVITELSWPLFDVKRIGQEYDKWQIYKKRIPVVGAALLNEAMTHVVRVRGPNASHFNFPRGKINKQEDIRCACQRETYEETGIRVELDQCKEEYTIQVETARPHTTKYYVVDGIPMDVQFNPMSPEEIAEVKWEDINKIDAAEQERLKEVIEKIKRDRAAKAKN